tara:strand:+ start:108 stop:1097 length:990 start_codon:yes stop_codon:yes gene_type:complete
MVIDYYSEDSKFLNDISNSNGKSLNFFTDLIEKVVYDSSGYKTYRIKKMYFSNMGLDSLPPSIGNLDSLEVVTLNDNQFQFISESICSVFDQLDTLDLFNNDICTPSIPECIERSTTITQFYTDQNCTIIPDERDRDFITDLIEANWSDTSTTFIDLLKNTYTKWEDFWEEGQIVSRITEIRYDNKSIKIIPNSIGELDSLRWLELQNNNINEIPAYIGNLELLEYFAIFQNNIMVLPHRIDELVNLEVLKVSENKLESILSDFGKLKKLNQLWLSENNLISLPESMCVVLTNENIDVYIDNNLLCVDINNDCFSDLINYSSQQSDCED